MYTKHKGHGETYFILCPIGNLVVSGISSQKADALLELLNEEEIGS